MRYCQNCGKEASGNEKFCLECGKPLPYIQNSKIAITPDTPEADPHRSKGVEPTVKRQNKEPLGLGKKIAIISIIVLVALLGGTHYYITKITDPEKQLTEVNKYFVAEDVQNFTNTFKFSEDTIVDAKGFYQYMEENDWADSIRYELEDAVGEVQRKGYADPIVDREGNKVITVLEEKFLIFYKKINYQVHPIEVSSVSENHNATITFANTDLKEVTDKGVLIGKFAPGKYSYTVTLKDDYFQKSIEEEVTIQGNGKNEYLLELDLSDHLVNLTSDIEEAIVYIDGKSTEKTASELALVAAPLDGSVEIYAETKNQDKTVKSEILKLTDEDQHIKFPEVQQKLKVEQEKKAKEQAVQDFYKTYNDQARNLFLTFRENYNIAVNNADFSFVQSYFVDGSQLRRDYEKFVVEHDSLGYYSYDFVSNEVLSVEPDTSKSLKLDSREIFRFYSEEDGTWRYERNKRYIIEEVNNELKITSIQDISDLKKTKID